MALLMKSSSSNNNDRLTTKALLLLLEANGAGNLLILARAPARPPNKRINLIDLSRTEQSPSSFNRPPEVGKQKCGHG